MPYKTSNCVRYNFVTKWICSLIRFCNTPFCLLQTLIRGNFVTELQQVCNSIYPLYINYLRCFFLFCFVTKLQSFRTEIRRDKKGIFAPCGGVKKAALKFGICCEAGSVTFCDRAGLNYVSCSPFRVPIARFAAAQAAVEEALQEIYRLGKSWQL